MQHTHTLAHKDGQIRVCGVSLPYAVPPLECDYPRWREKHSVRGKQERGNRRRRSSKASVETERERGRMEDAEFVVARLEREGSWEDSSVWHDSLDKDDGTELKWKSLTHTAAVSNPTKTQVSGVSSHVKITAAENIQEGLWLLKLFGLLQKTVRLSLLTIVLNRNLLFCTLEHVYVWHFV